MTTGFFKRQGVTGDLVPAETRQDRDFSKGRTADTSRAAFRRTSDQSRAKQRRAIAEAVRAAGGRGATCEELSDRLRIPYSSASGRISELTHARILRDSKMRRLTKYGRPARVHILNEEADGKES